MEELFSPHVAILGRPNVAPEPDAVDPSFAEGTPDPLKSDLVEMLGEEQVLSRVTDLVRHASDASQCRYFPQVVVRPKSIEDMQALFGYCRDNGRHATFRSGGTSINGQAQSDDILIDVWHDWSGWEVLDDGLRFKSRTGTLLGRANQALALYQRQLGPDPPALRQLPWAA
jgi:D-lactate dehydrogenase